LASRPRANVAIWANAEDVVMPVQPILYLPVENKNREFDAKLLVAAAAAERGILAVIGQQTVLARNAHKLPAGVYLFKGLNRVQTGFMQHAAKFGHAVAAHDEEALGLCDAEHMSRYVADDLARNCHLVLAQGAFQESVLKDRCGLSPDMVAVAGNPRTDLLRPPFLGKFDDEAARHAERFGPFVLVNTNMSVLNSAWGTPEEFLNTLVQIGWLDREKPSDMAAYAAHTNQDRLNGHAIRAVLDGLPAAAPGHRIIIRPHPSESMETWEREYAARPGFSVVREGSHIAWMRAARLILHTGCTTGLEGAICGCPSISVVPDGLSTDHWYTSNKVSLTVKDAATALAATRSAIAGGEDVFLNLRAGLDEILKEHLSIGDGWSHERMVSLLSDRFLQPGDFEQPLAWRPVAINPNQERTERDKDRLVLRHDEVIDRMRELGGLMGRFGDLVVRPMWESLFMIHAPGRLRVVR
jgi:surface carbohydrate biosynthesis protein